MARAQRRYTPEEDAVLREHAWTSRPWSWVAAKLGRSVRSVRGRVQILRRKDPGMGRKVRRSRVNRPWTNLDKRRALALDAAGKAPPTIARCLNRSERAVRIMLVRLRGTRRAKAHTRLRPAEVRTILRLSDEGQSIPAIVAAVGRCKDAVRAVLKEHRPDRLGRHRAFTTEDDATLRRMAEAKVPTAAIARALGRSHAAVVYRASSIGVSLRKYVKGHDWTGAEVRRARALRDAHWTFAAIGKELGRSPGAVRQALARARKDKP